MKKRYYGLKTENISEREKENRKLAYETACEGIVLLKNDGVLPFTSNEIALYGFGSRMTIKGGTGSGDVNERYSVNIEEGFKNNGISVLSQNWLNKVTKEHDLARKKWEEDIESRVRKYKIWETQKMFDEVINPAHFNFVENVLIEKEDLVRCSTAVYVISRQAGESSDRRYEKGDYLLSDSEIKNIAFLQENYEKLILVINCGSQVELGGIDMDKVNAVIYMMQAGEEGGNALADIVTGKVNPSGKLSDSWALKYKDYPVSDKYGILGNVLEQDYVEGIYVGYRYFDTFDIKTQFGFGHGLSYTSFNWEVKDIRVNGSAIDLNVSVANTGDRYSGKEVIQVYLAKPQGNLRTEKRSLAAFGKTRLLQPGESDELRLSFDLKDQAVYDAEKAAFLLPEGEYGLFLGNSLESSVPVAVAVLDNETITEQCRNLCVNDRKVNEITASFSGYEYDDKLRRIDVNSDSIEAEVHEYRERSILVKTEETARYLSELTDDELITLTVGGGYGGGDVNVTPSVAGKTTTTLTKKGIVNVNLTDGPAGLRLSQKNAYSKVLGMQRYIDGVPENWRWGWIRKVEPLLVSKSVKNLNTVYQYMTAFPCATLQACSWNEELVEKVGKGIALEMIETGCTLWLAPGMNIHRNPLCGRNFEYYSEDPLLSGKFAAAVTKGVQHYEGIGTTIKHFCCNNQEDKREYMSSNVSERALREIYLKGFHIAVREAKPWALMTSYNKLNGIYTPNNKELCVDILRNEWGYEGLVMTDWGSCGTNKGDLTACHKAGNDLIEPGGNSVVKYLLEEYKKGLIDMNEIRKSAANVLNVIFSSMVK